MSTIRAQLLLFVVLVCGGGGGWVLAQEDEGAPYRVYNRRPVNVTLSPETLGEFAVAVSSSNDDIVLSLGFIPGVKESSSSSDVNSTGPGVIWACPQNEGPNFKAIPAGDVLCPPLAFSTLVVAAKTGERPVRLGDLTLEEYLALEDQFSAALDVEAYASEKAEVTIKKPTGKDVEDIYFYAFYVTSVGNETSSSSASSFSSSSSSARPLLQSLQVNVSISDKLGSLIGVLALVLFLVALAIICGLNVLFGWSRAIFQVYDSTPNGQQGGQPQPSQGDVAVAQDVQTSHQSSASSDSSSKASRHHRSRSHHSHNHHSSNNSNDSADLYNSYSDSEDSEDDHSYDESSSEERKRKEKELEAGARTTALARLGGVVAGTVVGTAATKAKMTGAKIADSFSEEDGGASHDQSQAVQQAIKPPKQWTDIFFLVILAIADLGFSAVRCVVNLALIHSSFTIILPPAVLPDVSVLKATIPDLSFVFSISDFFLIFENLASIGSWNCHGAIVMFLPTLVIIMTGFLYVIIHKDLLLFFAIRINRFHKTVWLFKGVSGGALLTAISALLQTLMLYVVQFSMTITMRVFIGFAFSQSSCSAFDFRILFFARLITYGITVLALFCITLFFTGKPTNNHAKFHWIPQTACLAFDALQRVLLLTFGLWTPNLVKSHNIVGRAAKFDDDEEDLDNQHERVMSLVAKSRSVIFFLPPGCTILAKIGETLSNPPIFVFTNTVSLKTSGLNRFISVCGQVITLGLVVVTAFGGGQLAMVLMFASLMPTALHNFLMAVF